VKSIIRNLAAITIVIAVLLTVATVGAVVSLLLFRVWDFIISATLQQIY